MLFTHTKNLWLQCVTRPNLQYNLFSVCLFSEVKLEFLNLSIIAPSQEKKIYVFNFDDNFVCAD